MYIVVLYVHRYLSSLCINVNKSCCSFPAEPTYPAEKVRRYNPTDVKVRIYMHVHVPYCTNTTGSPLYTSQALCLFTIEITSLCG